jgi:transposase
MAELDEHDCLTLTSWARSSSVRVKVVLAIAVGQGPSAVSRRFGISRSTVTQWRDRFLAAGLDGLDDAPRSGWPKTIDDAAILASTLEPPPHAWA